MNAHTSNRNRKPKVGQGRLAPDRASRRAPRRTPPCRRRASVPAIALIVCWAALTTVSNARETVDVSREVAADARISINNISGLVEVTGWDRKEVRITGWLDDEIEELRVEGDAQDLEIEVKYPRRSGSFHVDAELEIKVPAGCQLHASTVNADIDVTGLAGEVTLTTVNGDIDIEGSPKRLKLQSVSGDFALDIDSPRAEISTVSGDLDISGPCKRLRLESVSGDIDVTAGPLSELEANTVSGDIEFAGTLEEDADVELNSQSGTIVFYMPAGFGAEFSVNTFSGDIDSEFGDRPERKSRFVPGEELEFKVGSGQGSVDINTFSGDVDILKP